MIGHSELIAPRSQLPRRIARTKEKWALRSAASNLGRDTSRILIEELRRFRWSAALVSYPNRASLRQAVLRVAGLGIEINVQRSESAAFVERRVNIPMNSR